MIRKNYLEIDVLEQAQQLIQTVFDTGVNVLLSFSAGKDSIVMADIVYRMILKKQINPEQIEVVFIDEELIFDEIVTSAKLWREKFLSVGVKFTWYCVEVAYFNTFDQLDNRETFVQWDKSQKANWLRKPPHYAVMDNEYLINRKDGYRDWLPRLANAKGQVSMIGLYAEESITRTISLASKKGIVNSGIFYPLISWNRENIWFYLRKYNLEYPKIYEDLYRIGVPKGLLRLAPMTSIDTAKYLHNLAEIRPDLLQRIEKRVPNAYLSVLYWDTPLFRGVTKNKERSKREESLTDYKAESLKAIRLQDDRESKQLHRILVMNSTKIEDSRWKDIYRIVVAKDPKNRAIRQLIQRINDDSKRRN